MSTTAPVVERDIVTLTNDELHCEVLTRTKEFHTLTRAAQAAERERLLPIIKEVKTRLDAGQSVGGHTGIEAYIESIGLKPATVRRWKLREKEVQNTEDKAAESYREEWNRKGLTRNGDQVLDVASAIQKFIRYAPHPDAPEFAAWEKDALAFWADYDLAGGVVLNKLAVIASEDKGLADNNLVVRIRALIDAGEPIRNDPRVRSIIIDAVRTMLRVPSNRKVDEALNYYFPTDPPSGCSGVPPEGDEEAKVLREYIDRYIAGKEDEVWADLLVAAHQAEDPAVLAQVAALYRNWRGFKEHCRIFFVHAVMIVHNAAKRQEAIDADAVYAYRKRTLPAFTWDGKHAGDDDHPKVPKHLRLPAFYANVDEYTQNAVTVPNDVYGPLVREGAERAARMAAKGGDPNPPNGGGTTDEIDEMMGTADSAAPHAHTGQRLG